MLTEFPETRESLLVQVRSPANREAWDQFAMLYRPVIYRLARGFRSCVFFSMIQMFVRYSAGIAAMRICLSFLMPPIVFNRDSTYFSSFASHS